MTISNTGVDMAGNNNETDVVAIEVNHEETFFKHIEKGTKANRRPFSELNIIA
ncbi:unnamed protein product [Dovyalis caffra]|uniref:Uncharacterized protein n=1 Tax=Dovyalis caffra TaxID=77055 RepID=A0AAV1R2U9_9ROSI|nr:unnamed protein product [Dovyalis caffra]